MKETKMRPTLNVDEFINMNRKAFLQVTGGKRLKASRRKPRSREEFLAMGRVVVAAIKQAEAEGRFQYDPEKGLTIKKWKD